MTTGGAWAGIAWGVVATGMGLLVATDYRPHGRRRSTGAVVGGPLHSHGRLVPWAEVPFLDLTAILAARQRVVDDLPDAPAS